MRAAERRFIQGRRRRGVRTMSTTTRQQQAARRVSYQLETLWDYDYEPTHQELDTLYEPADRHRGSGAQRAGGVRGHQLLQPPQPRGAEGRRDPRVDPLLKAVLDEILATNMWELKLLGMQMIVEGLAIAAFNVMRRQTADPRSASSSTTSCRTRDATSTSATSRSGARSPTWRPPSASTSRTSPTRSAT